MKDNIQLYSYFKLMMSSIIVAVLSGVLAYSLKHLTTYCQDFLFEHVEELNRYLYLIFPSIGITVIYFLRKYLFQNRKNKGIREIYRSLDTRQDHLPFYKIPSHYINGFLTVIFGGSTGIEVSTVVSTATIGNQFCKRGWSPMKFKKELVCAAVTAGVAVLFGTVLGGWFFAIEVIARGMKKTVLLSCTVAAAVAFVGIHYFEKKPLISFPVDNWHWYGLPFMAVLAILGALLAIYFMKLVLTCKHFFAKINSNFLRVNIGAITIGSLIFVFPALYGDSYHGLNQMIKLLLQPDVSTTIPVSLFFLILLKPLTAALTLGAGGDGGVFAPSIVAGAFLGIAFALVCNFIFGLDLLILNFALIGAASTLAAAIHGRFTAVFLMCSLVPNGYMLIFPIAMAVWIAYAIAKKITPYNVYTYPEMAK
ncbi:chloride channel protein [Sphingobacterium sp. SRCM116780]|uniref:chloride channel protein n=1 Tax=Sphingobacterium sp. SRCM116780 TaxID=2907623 RepID=UPI001F42AB09|nr:chloride channel protein [Sphingobacterium sp. SRCM116780]UIR56022.1 chloride channel protein [Sphingobacterium sp. SRCM116780]